MHSDSTPEESRRRVATGDRTVSDRAVLGNVPVVEDRATGRATERRPVGYRE
jgi:hypothetical protein